jgi:ATP-dependent exoDNAse (exonuclease V) alpha subunit
MGESTIKSIHFEVKKQFVYIGVTAYSISYIFGIIVRDNRLGKNHNEKRDDVLYSKILLPVNAPPEYADPQTFVDELEKAEYRRGAIKNIRSDARILRKIIVGLPNELAQEELIALAERYVMENYVNIGMCTALAVHKGDNVTDPAKSNPHMHILTATRPVEPDGSGFSIYKERAWNARSNVSLWREQFAAMANTEYERKELSIQYDHRNFVRQGLDREAMKRLNRRDYECELRGELTRAGEANRARAARNAERERIKLELQRKENERRTIAQIQQEIDRGYEFER